MTAATKSIHRWCIVGRVKPLVTVVELKHFSRRAARIWSHEEMDEFIAYIAENPESGDVVENTGGVRKVRWASQGRGKRGGARIIYFFRSAATPLFLLDFYAKNEKSDLGSDDKRALRGLVRTLTEEISNAEKSS
jgi:hypothetical protein